MPICDDPNATGFYWLRSDEAKPLATRPMFICRFVTRSQRRENTRILDQAYETPNDAACFVLLMQSIRVGVTGWRNFADKDGKPIEFNEENLSERLRDVEIWELARNWPSAVTLTEDDLKNSALPASDAPAKSASNASEISA